jgi:hypothetical protein
MTSRLRIHPSLVRSAAGALALLAMAMANPPRLAAQSQGKALVPSGTGFSIAGDLTFARAASRGSGLDGSDARPGGRVELAYGVSPRLSLVGALHPLRATVRAQDYTANGVDLGLRYLAQAGRTLRPFAEGGFAVRTLTYKTGTELTSRNVGPWAGLGLMRLAASHWSGEAALTWGKSTFDNWKADGTAAVAEPVSWDAVGARVGVRYWVHAR